MNNNSMQWVLGGALALIGLFVLIALIGVTTQANDVTTSANVTNVAPTVDSIYVNDTENARIATYNDGTTQIALTAGGLKTIHVNGVVSDLNGVGTGFASGDLESVSVSFYRSSVSSGATCAPSDTSCYQPSTGQCAVTQYTATSLYYDCGFSINYFTDSSSTGGSYTGDSWVVRIGVRDDSLVTGSSSVSTVEVGTLLALQVPESINYGILSRAETTTLLNNQQMVLTQWGNDQATVEVSAGDMTCSVFGTIPAANQKWSLIDVGFSHASASALSGILASVASSLLDYRSDGSGVVSSNLYWNISMPTAVSGTCTGTNVVSALAATAI